jgi:hypothetical protein
MKNKEIKSFWLRQGQGWFSIARTQKKKGGKKSLCPYH